MKRKLISATDILGALVYLPYSSNPKMDIFRQVIELILRYMGKILAVFIL